MPLFRKKPVVIEAIQWTGDNGMEMSNYMPRFRMSAITEDRKLQIHTLEGVMEASIGDFIIKGISGEFYPCKPDIFEKTYDPA